MSYPEFKITMRRTKQPKTTIVQALLDRPALAIRELNNRSFYRFLVNMWPEISNEEMQENWHMEYICNQLQTAAEKVAANNHKRWKDPVDDIIINVPPGTSKTTIVMIAFPAWCWTRWYWMKFICLSYTATLALESAEACRDLVRSDSYQSYYPDISIKPDKDQKSNFTILKTFGKRPGYPAQTKIGGKRFTTSVGGTLTGFHGHILLVDDPINPQQAVSPDQLDSTNRWLDNTLTTRKVHKESSPTFMIMQRLAQGDPTGHKLEKDKKGKIQHICIPGEIKTYKDQVKPKELLKYYTEDGLMDPVRLTHGALEKLEEDLGQYGYAGQVGQSPTPPSGGMFKPDNILDFDTMPHEYNIEQVVRYWDKAGTTVKPGSKSRQAAYTVGVKMAKTTDGRFLILNVVRFRHSAEKREQIIKQTAEADGYDVLIGIEQEPGSGGKESAENTVKNLAGYRVRVDRPVGDKVYRADPFSVQVNGGNVSMLQGAWNKDYIEELKFFPFGTYKDQVDASSGAFALLNGKKVARVIGRG